MLKTLGSVYNARFTKKSEHVHTQSIVTLVWRHVVTVLVLGWLEKVKVAVHTICTTKNSMTPKKISWGNSIELI